MINDNELALCVRKSMDDYFRHLDGEKPSAVYDMVISHVEKPLLQFILDHAQGNQTRAAEILGLNRNTLRKKLKTYGLQ
jgi:Fis family transcriptional regulator